MDRPKLEVADVFRRYGEAYRQDNGASLSMAQRLVMTVGADATVKPKIVTTGELRGGLRVIRSGLDASDRVIIDGLVRVRPGAVVEPKEGQIVPEKAD